MRLPRSLGCTATVSSLEPLAEQRLDLLGAQHLLQHRPVGADQHEPVHGVLLQPQPAVARHRLGDVDQQRVRHRVAAVGQQRVDHLLGVVPGGPRVPQAERGEPVGVHVLGCALQLGERRDRPAALAGPARGRPRAAASCRTGRSAGRRSSAPPLADGPGRPPRWRARSTGRSSSGGTGWGRCPRRPGGTGTRWHTPSRVGPRSQTSVARPSSISPISRSRDRRGAAGHVQVQAGRVVVADLRRHRVLGQQGVEARDHVGDATLVGGDEDRPQPLGELCQPLRVPRCRLLLQSLATRQERHQRVEVHGVGVEQRRAGLGVPEEVHALSLRTRRSQLRPT